MRTVLALVLLACLAAGAWLVLARNESLPPASGPAASAPQEVVASQAAVSADATPPAAASRRAAAPEVPGPGITVQVVRVPGQEPVAQATVHVLPPDFDGRKSGPELEQLARTDYEAFERRIGLAFTTDAAGRCRVPVGKTGTQVTATKDALFGRGYAAIGGPDPLVIQVRTDQTLHARVVDAGANPVAGVLVAARRPATAQPMTWHMGNTDATGRFEQRHFQQYAMADDSANLELLALFPGGESSPATVVATALPAEVVLHLPAAGTVTVRALDADGQPLDPTYLAEANVRLLTFAQRPANAQAENEARNAARGSVPLDARGTAVFGTVAFGGFLMADLNWVLRSAVVPAPTRDTPQVELTLREGSDALVLVGTLLGADAAPLRSAGFMLTCRYRNGMSSQQARTDAAGRFRFSLPLPAGPITVGFDTGIANRAAPLAAELAPRSLVSGRNDLGEVRLAPHTILAQGRVVTADNAPPALQIQTEVQREGRWQQEWNLHPEWSAGGVFTLRSGIARGTPIRLSLQTTGFLPVAPIECKAGDTGIEIQLHKGGSARATFLVDPALPLEHLVLRFRPTEPPSARDERAERMERMTRYAGPHQVKDGRLTRDWQGLKPGRYCLLAQCAGVAEPLVTIDAVTIGDGPCADPRLVDIDLRGRLRSFEVRAIGSDGNPIASPEAFVVIRSTGEDWCGFHLATGVARITAPGPVDLIVVARGHQAAFVTAVSEARTVALTAAVEARVAIALPVPLPDGAELRLHLQPDLRLPRLARMQLNNGHSMGIDSFFVEEVAVDATGKATVPVRYPGIYTVEATVAFGRRGGTYMRDFTPRQITLPATTEVAVRLGQQDLERALAAARR